MKQLVAERRQQSWVVALFVLIIVLQVLLGTLSLDILSATRAFVTGESLWSKAQRDAVLHLKEYIAEPSEAEYQAFWSALAVPLSDRRAREEMNRPSPDADLVRREFTGGGLHRDDIAGMSRLYRWWHATPVMEDAVAAWIEADAGIAELGNLMVQARTRMTESAANDHVIDSLSRRTRELDTRLSALERRFSEQLGDASRRTQDLLVCVNLSLAAALTILIVRFALRTFQRRRKVEFELRQSNQRWELAANSAHLGIFDWSLRQGSILLDDRARALTGMVASGVGTVSPALALNAIHPDDGERVSAAFQRAKLEGLPIQLQCRFVAADGRTIHVELSGGFHSIDTDKAHAVGVLRDITEETRVQAALRQQAAQQGLIATFGQKALENPDIDELIAEAVRTAQRGLDAELCRLLVPGATGATLRMAAGAGWDETWMQGHVYDAAEETQDQFVLGAREAMFMPDFAGQARFVPSAALRAHGVRSGVAVLICGASEPYGVLGAYGRRPNEFNEESANFLQGIAHALAAAIDRRNADDRLSRMAQFDALTGLPNRGVYLDRLSQTIALAQRDHIMFGVLFVDIDRFKLINDTLGHGVGDNVLVQIAARLQASLREIDTVGRLGGDEFAVTLGHLAKVEDAARVAQKIVDALAAPLSVDGRDVTVSASVGISLWPVDGKDPDTLLNNADRAMYRAKDLGRNGFQFYLPEMNERVAERVRIEAELRVALERGEFLLHYQPKASLLTGKISGLEALLRWQHPERGLVAPGEFISILEENGLIVPVGEWVVAEVCRQLVAWAASGLEARPVAINISGRQFRQRNLDRVIEDILISTGVNPRLLEFELTESVLMGDSEASVQALRNLKNLGVSMSVDDFGTGYSSLAYLKRFPIDCLKIDRAFIRDVSTDANDTAIVIAIISLARGLNLKVVAEGVETREQLDFLRKHGCDEMQGYYFARPLTVAECTRELAAGRSLYDSAIPASTTLADSFA